jgi:hypothetical protein
MKINTYPFETVLIKIMDCGGLPPLSKREQSCALQKLKNENNCTFTED